ncbi:KGK domain-containing protein [Iningainema tapete]|uniref:KGK family protein n=1 Tax=Iningainema tapete BLCC-T55 TaxID=2748662 RepID=A0A8J6XAQ3_9CYAN|nr:KGK domain-containing protein [Iningainema tapete]MBD2771440.1 hypothetical protein [Iningainema tapete BLCC-T55]
MDNEFSPLSEDDVVSVTSAQILMPHSTFKVDEFMTRMTQVLPGNDDLKHKWLSKGQSCQILKPGSKNWQKGKVRIRLEFCPDEYSSPLDDIRQQLKETET